MSRYIEEEAIIKAIDESGRRYGITTANQCNFKEIVMKIPTADAVPKSEVERLEREVRLLTENSITVKYPHCVLGSYYAVLTKSLEDYEKVVADISSAAKAEVAREIFEEIEKATASVYNDFMFSRESIGANATAVVIFSDELDIAIDNLKEKYTKGGEADA